ncbi:MAG: hypothetical protein ACT4QG_00455 [Sporichthyaceae bacterium]
MRRARRFRTRSALFGAATLLTAGTLVGGLGVGLVAHVYARSSAPSGDCATRAAASDALQRMVFASVPESSVRFVDSSAATELECAPGPVGFQALWTGATGAQTVRLLQDRGWRRADPAEGTPEWFLRDEPAAMDAPAGAVIVLDKAADGRRFGVAVNRLGMSAWAE